MLADPVYFRSQIHLKDGWFWILSGFDLKARTNEYFQHPSERRSVLKEKLHLHSYCIMHKNYDCLLAVRFYSTNQFTKVESGSGHENPGPGKMIPIPLDLDSDIHKRRQALMTLDHPASYQVR